ncbi:MAG: helix-turn-helix domain-containing protein [Chloroflexota bacterium]|nr:helix-turn-helix domain-containing protein [Chloroflexota bacterium]
MDARAQHRLYVLQHVAAGRINIDEAARILKLSVRQIRRLQAGYRAKGPAALVHGNSGRAPAHRTPHELRERLVRLASEEYAGINRAHLAELLAEREGIELPVRSLRRILAEAGVKPVRRRRPPRHRSRRERMAREGLLLQVDGSRHDWLEGRGPMLTLVGGIDDATGLVTGATFRLQEDAAGYSSCSARPPGAMACRRRSTPIGTASSSSIAAGRRRSPSSSAASSPSPRSAVRWTSSISAGSAPTAHRQRAASSGCGRPGRIA